MNATIKLTVTALAASVLCWTLTGRAAEPSATKSDPKVALFDGKAELRAPEKWERRKPASNIVEHEFRVPASKGDENDGRMTVMAAGGSIDDNLKRWYDQFTQPDGGSTKDRAKIKKFEVAGQTVRLVDISGTFKDQKGPFAPAVERAKYRMLGAIVSHKDEGNYYVKFYGPQQTVADHEKAFTAMIEQMQSK